MIYTVSEDIEIILDGKKFLLEKGDKIIVEAINLNISRVMKEIGDEVLNNFNVDMEEIESGMEEEKFNKIKNFVKAMVKNNPDYHFKVTDGTISDILDSIKYEISPSEDWKNYERPSEKGMRQFAGEKEKLKEKQKLDRDKLHSMIGAS